MRLWSLHPKYLDSAGLVALWREALLARKVLEGRTTGYRNHPQLERFRNTPDPGAAADAYLLEVFKEACSRGYRFGASKVYDARLRGKIFVTSGQLDYEFRHLLAKLEKRSPEMFLKLKSKKKPPDPHPLFRVVRGPVEVWEKMSMK